MLGCDMTQARQVMADHHRALRHGRDPRSYLFALVAETAGECAVICEELATWPGYESDSATYMDRAFALRCQQMDAIQALARLMGVPRGR